MPKLVLETTPRGVADSRSAHEDIKFSDGGQSRSIELHTAKDDCLFVEIKSWDDKREHETLVSMNGKPVRVTIEW